MRINLADNNQGQTQQGVYSRGEVAALFPLAGKSVAALCEEHERLLLFPHSLQETEDKIGEEVVFRLENTADPEQVRIVTGNVMGFIGVGGLHIKIQSRFDEGRDDFFLHYMLQKVFSLNLFDLNHNHEEEAIFDFLLYLFPAFLKTALRQGVYREYRRYQHNDARLRGAMNIGRHIALNVPFVENMAYSTREYSHDNHITQLIRHTIECIKTKKHGRAALSIDRETQEGVKTIIDHTPSYKHSERKQVVSQSLRTKAHPYYTAYQPLQQLCLQILSREEVKYGEQEEEVCGILFDGAWLWEEYVDTILSKEGFTHPKNKEQKGAIYLFENQQGARYPDFYKEGFVLDAKYKRLGECKAVHRVGRDDVHQMIAYMLCLNAEKGGFFAPFTGGQAPPRSARLANSAATLAIYGIEIRQNAASYADFCERMRGAEGVFVASLRELRGENMRKKRGVDAIFAQKALPKRE